MVLLPLLPYWVICEQDVIYGDHSAREDDAVSTARCLEGSVLVNCEILVQDNFTLHDGMRISDGDCVASNARDYTSVQVSNKSQCHFYWVQLYW